MSKRAGQKETKRAKQEGTALKPAILSLCVKRELRGLKLASLPLLAVGSALSPLAVAQTAPASSSSDDGLQEIVVNGYLKSLAEALKAKRESDITKDVIIAEDMAKFPELNLAESIQRLPGVAITREAGEGREISLRGLGPDFTRVQLNGMEVLGNNDSAMDSRGQRSRDRAFDFNLFASELFSKVEVEKTFQAAQNEGGMAGTVGLFTGKPFDYATGLKGAISAKGGTNTYTNDFQPRVAGLVSYNWDNTLGALVSVAWSRRKTQEQGVNTYNYNHPSASDLANAVAQDPGLISSLSPAQQAKFLSGDLYFPDGNRLSVWDSDQKRLGITASVQWKPADSLLFTLDGLHGEYTTVRNEYHLATRPFNGSGSGAWDYGTIGPPGWPNTINLNSTINSISYDNSNFVNAIDVSNATFGSEHRRELNENHFNMLELTGKWEANDRLTVDGHVGAQTSTYHTPYDDKLYLRAQGNFSSTYAANGQSASNVYGFNTSNPANYFMDDFYFRGFYNDTTEREAALNLKFAFADGYDMRAGYAYHRYWSAGQNWFDDGNQNGTDNPASSLYTRGAPVGAFTNVFCENKQACWLTGDYARAFKYFGITFQSPQYYQNQAFDIEQTFAVTEKTDDAYAQFDWDQHIAGKRFRGNIGARFYHTSTESTGWIQGNSYAYQGTQTVGSSYSGVLPALNSVLELTPETLLRFAATQNLNRPTLSSLAAQGGVTQNSDSSYNISFGNPKLKPFKDTTLDLSVEYYFHKTGLLSLGVFHKDIKNWISSFDQQNVTFAQTGLALTPQLTAMYPGLTAASPVKDYSYPTNVAKVKLNGAEFAVQAPFFFLPAPFDNLGVLGNVAYVKGDEQITGLSKLTANTTLYYETARWGLRGSLSHRSSYQTQPLDSNPNDGAGYFATTYVDAAAFVNVLPGLQVTLDAINLTNEAEIENYSAYHRLYNKTQSGTTLFLGANYKFL
ncbi:MAG TPA: TonB-dependent receptor [Steroidobacteraceae bacterium]